MPQLTVRNPFVRLACAAFLAWSTTSVPAIAEEPRSLSVTGQGQIAIPATIAQVSLGVEIRARTAEEAQMQAAAASNAIVAYLKDRNVDRLQTQGIQLSPVYVYEDNRALIEGYTASNMVSFRIETEVVGEILDEAVQLGATQISGLSFVGTDAAIATARNEALRAATLDAREQADVVLRTLDLTADSVSNIYIGYSTPMAPVSMATEGFAFVAADSAPRSAVEGGDQTISASVTLTILY